MEKRRKIVIKPDIKGGYKTKEIELWKDTEFFHPVFQQANLILSEIILETNEFTKKYSEKKYGISFEKDIREYGNNIISFCAGRGHGKTSVLQSYGEILKQCNDKESAHTLYKKLGNVNFCVLPTIDPTMLENKGSILKTIFSRMFVLFKESEKKRQNCCDRMHTESNREQEIKNLLKLFSACFESVDVTKENKNIDSQSYGDNLEKLSQLGDSANLKIQFYQLISAFLRYMHQDREGQNFLVISIDDADMNVENSYGITEDLRKYTVLPQVFVMIASDLEQLGSTVEQHFLEAFQHISCHYSDETKELCHKLSPNYINKLLPMTHQIYLPDINKTLKNSNNQIILEVETEKSEEEPWEYQADLLKAMGEKLGVFLVPPKKELHYMLPDTMRNLSHFKSFMQQLTDISVEYEGKSYYVGEELLDFILFSTQDEQNKKVKFDCLMNWKHNLEQYENYFLLNWSALQLGHDEQEILNSIYNSPFLEKKKVIFDKIWKFTLFKQDKTKLEIEKEWNGFSCLSGETLADLRCFLEKIAEYLPSKHHKFIYAVQFYVSLFCTSLLVDDLTELVTATNKNQGDPSFQPSSFLEFSNGAEFPWELHGQKTEAEFCFGGFPVSPKNLLVVAENKTSITKKKGSTRDSVYLEFLASFLVSRPTESKEKKKGEFLFDPANLSNVFLKKNLNKLNPYFSMEIEQKKNYVLGLFLLSLNWDLQNQLMESLLTYQNGFSKKNETPAQRLQKLKNKVDSTENQAKVGDLQSFFYNKLAKLYDELKKEEGTPPSKSTSKISSKDMFQVNPKIKRSEEHYFRGMYKTNFWGDIYLSNDTYYQKINKSLDGYLNTFLDRFPVSNLEIPISNRVPDYDVASLKMTLSHLEKQRDFAEGAIASNETLKVLFKLDRFFVFYEDYLKYYKIELEEQYQIMENKKKESKNEEPSKNEDRNKSEELDHFVSSLFNHPSYSELVNEQLFRNKKEKLPKDNIEKLKELEKNMKNALGMKKNKRRG